MLNIKNYGAVADGVTVNTKAIQRAISLKKLESRLQNRNLIYKMGLIHNPI